MKALAGKRVLALTMHAIVGDLEGIELVGDGADAVLLGGADETPETNLVFSYMNLARAFAELELGAELYCLHRNRWWQTKHGPQFDAGAFVAGLEYAAGVEAVVLGKPSPSYFAAACEALDADPNMTWMVGDDLESDVVGAQGVGMKTVLVRTGKFRPDAVERRAVAAGRHRLVDRPSARVDRGAPVIHVGTDLIEIDADPPLARALRALPRPLLHGGEQAYCDSRPNPAESYAGRFAGKEAVGKALGFGVARAFAWKDIEIVGRPKPSVRLSGRVAAWAERVGAGDDRSLDDALAGARAGGCRRLRWLSSSRSTPPARCVPPRRATRAIRALRPS